MEKLNVNVASWERLLSLASGALIIGRLVAGKKPMDSTLLQSAGLGLGAGLVFRGVTGHCPVYKAADFNTVTEITEDPVAKGVIASVAIRKPLSEVVKALPLAAKHIHRGDCDQWWFLTIGGVEFSLEVVENKNVTFINAQWSPGKPASNSLETILPKSTHISILTATLRNLKAVLETGEIATIEGQSHGERSAKGGLLQKASQAVQDKIVRDNLTQDAVPALLN